MGVEDKEYPVKVTDEMILKYEKMIYAVYLRRFACKYYYLKDDLLQCGRWGVFLAYQRYERRAKNKCNFTVFVWLNIRTKMGHYIKHEKNHFLKETNNYCFEDVEFVEDISFSDKIDINNAIARLKDDYYTQLLQWANYVSTRKMNYRNNQSACYHLKKIFKQLREILQYDKL